MGAEDDQCIRTVEGFLRSGNLQVGRVMIPDQDHGMNQVPFSIIPQDNPFLPVGMVPVSIYDEPVTHDIRSRFS